MVTRAYPRDHNGRFPLTRLAQHTKLALFRPSVRLKSALCVLGAVVVVLIVVAVNALHARFDAAAGAARVHTVPAADSPADSGAGVDAAKGKDAHLVDGEIQRSFEEPDYALLSGAQPHEIGCDVPLDGKDAGVLVYLGIFSTADRKDRRDLYRRTVLPDFPPHLVTVKFILGLPPFPENPLSQEAVARSLLLARLHQENEDHGDLVLLPMVDNIDLGKTHEYFKHVARTFAGPGRVRGRPRFVVKADDDTILVMPNLVAAFARLDCATNVYWGTSAGRSGYFGDYFRGLAYAMSWPLVSWIGSANMTLPHIIKIEDARTGQWLRHLDPVTDPVRRIDMGWTMGDWNQLDVTTATVALHWLKLDEWVVEQHARVLSIWAAAGRPYDAEHGVDPRVSARLGKQTPDEAQREHERQKELGWDVGDNVNDM
ncbi:hypothetical protein Q5752_002787 [Cryptotrichosporon argae]